MLRLQQNSLDLRIGSPIATQTVKRGALGLEYKENPVSSRICDVENCSEEIFSRRCHGTAPSELFVCFSGESGSHTQSGRRIE